MNSIITFSDSAYQNQADILKASLKIWAPQVKFLNFSPASLPSSLNDYCQLNPRGFGFWRWKMYIISEYYANMPIDSYVLYVDSTMIALPSVSNIFDQLPDIYISKNILPSPLNWCKNLSHRFDDFQDFLLYGSLCDSSIIGIRKNRTTQAFISSLALYNEHTLFNDDSIAAFEYPRLIEHRHDQSIFSYLCWKQKISFSPCITHVSSPYPIFFHSRIRKVLSKFAAKSLMKYIYILISVSVLRKPLQVSVVKINQFNQLR